MEETNRAFSHIPVLLNEVIEGLNIRENGIYVDGTLGGAGHSTEIYKRLKNGVLVGIDQDADAIAAASERLRKAGAEVIMVGCMEKKGETDYGEDEKNDSKGSYDAGKEDQGNENEPLREHSDAGIVREISKVYIFRSNYENFDSILDAAGIEKADGILLDLGVSSYQLDTPERGFSYNADAPLDMRMDDRQEKSAYNIVNEYSEGELYRVIRDYGEDRFAKNIAKHICEARKTKPIETTFELNEIIKAAIPAKVRATGGHPSKRTYQAIRIELNRELEVLENTLGSMIERLNENGRLCVITFHSLEDRIVKTAFNSAEKPCICPPDFPVCVCGRKSKGKHLTKKPIVPGEWEEENNPRAKSSKLRIFEKKSE